MTIPEPKRWQRPPTKSRLLTGCAAFLLAMTGSFATAQTDDHQYTSEAIEAGSRTYVQQCALCHGPQGEAVDGINLRLGQFRTASSDEDLRNIITSGAAGGRMPAFNLRDAELNGLIAFIRAGFDPSGIAVRIGDPNAGEAIFTGKGECSSCHRVNGQGPRTAPDLSDIGAIRTPSTLQKILLEPAAMMAPINRPLRIVTISEEVITGRRLNEDTYSVQLIDSNEQLRSIAKDTIATYELGSDPIHEPSTLSSDEIADLIGYLLTLRGLQ